MNMFQNPYACAVCQESFTIAEALVSHVKIKHKPTQPTEKEKDIKKSLCSGISIGNSKYGSRYYLQDLGTFVLLS